MYETIEKLEIQPAASAGVGFNLLNFVLRSRAVVSLICADYGGGRVFGGKSGLGIRGRPGPAAGFIVIGSTGLGQQTLADWTEAGVPCCEQCAEQ